MVSIRVRVAVLVALAAACHWLTRTAIAAVAPVFAFSLLTFLRHFHPDVAWSRLGPVAALRFLSVVAAITAWDGLVVLVSLSILRPVLLAAGIAAAASIDPHSAAPYAVLLLPLALAVKPPGPSLDWLSRTLVSIMYDVPMHIIVMLYWSVGWRLNSLATPVSSGEILLGALPYWSDAAVLRGKGVTGVVNLCREWQGPVRSYRRLGIEQLRIPTADGDMPSLEHAGRAMSFIRRHLRSGGRVFVHCRCGIGRSATVVLCYLVSERGWDVQEALDHLRRARPEVGPGIKGYSTVKAFAAAARARLAPGEGAKAGENDGAATAVAPVVGGEALAEARDEVAGRSSSAARRRRPRQ